jgi:hypothetical protein
MAKGDRILERRSGDPLKESPAGKRQPAEPPKGGEANWR